MKLERFDPPARMTDFHGIPGKLEQWSRAVSGWFDEAIESELELFRQNGRPDQPCQFFNPTKKDPGGSGIDQQFVWNGFPRTLELAYGQSAAYSVAEQLFVLSGRELKARLGGVKPTADQHCVTHAGIGFPIPALASSPTTQRASRATPSVSACPDDPPCLAILRHRPTRATHGTGWSEVPAISLTSWS